MVNGYEYDSDGTGTPMDRGQTGEEEGAGARMSAPSLINPSESTDTELTYATESPLPSRRQSAAVSNVGGDDSRQGAKKKLGVAAKLKRSLSSLVAKPWRFTSGTTSTMMMKGGAGAGAGAGVGAGARSTRTGTVFGSFGGTGFGTSMAAGTGTGTGTGDLYSHGQEGDVVIDIGYGTDPATSPLDRRQGDDEESGNAAAVPRAPNPTPRTTTRFSIASWRKSLRDTTKGSKPSEFLFWTGFIAPWCWLIGGWMLANDGYPVVEAVPKGVRIVNLKEWSEMARKEAREREEKERSMRDALMAANAKLWPNALSVGMGRQTSTDTVLPLYSDAPVSARLAYNGNGAVQQGEKALVGVEGAPVSMPAPVPAPVPSTSTSLQPPYPYPNHSGPTQPIQPQPFQEPTPQLTFPTDLDNPPNTDHYPPPPLPPSLLPLPQSYPYPYSSNNGYPFPSSISLFPIPGRPKFMMRRPRIKLNALKNFTATTKTTKTEQGREAHMQIVLQRDPWVTRCRIMAIVSGMLILVLCIIAFVVLVRAL